MRVRIVPWTRIAALGVAGVAGLTALAGATSNAEAFTGTNVTANTYSGDCYGGYYCLFYRVNGPFEFQGGSFGFNNYAPNLGQWQFNGCSQGGFSCPGYGQYVRNNASSMAALTCKGMTVWYSPGYTGDFNWVNAYSWGNFNSDLRNNEASTSKGNLC